MSPSRPPGTGRSAGAGTKPRRAARAREGRLPAAVTAMISRSLAAARRPSCGCASTARIASLATPCPVAAGARRQYALSAVPSAMASGVRPTTPSSPAGSGAGASCGGGPARCPSAASRARTVRYPSPCCSQLSRHRPSTQRIRARSVTGSVRSSTKARGSACSARSSSSSCSATGARRSRAVRSSHGAGPGTTAARRSPSGDGLTAPSCTGRSGVRRGEDSGVAAVAAALLVALGCLGIRVDLDLLGFHVGGAVLALQGRGHVARVGRADGVGDGRGVGLVRSGGGVVRPGEVGRRGPRVLDRAGLLPGDVARSGTRGGEAEDEQHLTGTVLLLLRGLLEDGRADVALALLELLARRFDGGLQHGAGGLHGPAGAREVVVLHVVAELVGAGAEVGRDLVGLLAQALLGLGRVL